MAQINLLRDRLEKNPRDLEALITLGNANYDIRRFDTARDLYRAALAVDPMNVQVRTDLATCYRQLGDADRAVEELRRVLAINPTHDTALYNLGVILLNDKKNSAEAIRVWEEFTTKHPQSPIATALGEKIRELKAVSTSTQ
jgi:tetratricopeptide (TPR) repeat protein